MKKLVLFFILISGIISYSYGQFDLKDKIKRKAKDRTERKTDQGIDKGFDKVEEGIGNIFKKDNEPEETTSEPDEYKSSGTEESSGQVSSQSSEQTSGVSAKETSPELKWSKYDFVPGDKVFFEDNLEGEENGEFPSRWDLARGNVENAEFGGENVIYFMTAASGVVPYVKNREQDYLPDIFTIEFDAWFEVSNSAQYYVYFNDAKKQSPLYKYIEIAPGGARALDSQGNYPGAESFYYNTKNSYWRHIAISFNKRALKVYLDDARVLNIPNVEFNPTGLTIGIENDNRARNRFIKNIRIAEGGVKLYDKFMQDGKIIANGIRFDSGKSTLKPESMGMINKIYKLMKDHPEIKFSVEGHTDSDGDDALNQALSEKRAKTVADKLISMGISQNRLDSKGWGESKPLNDNLTPEGKANNRRVEFVKM
jgi:OOP family OmpA-OmpF porin